MECVSRFILWLLLNKCDTRVFYLHVVFVHNLHRDRFCTSNCPNNILVHFQLASQPWPLGRKEQLAAKRADSSSNNNQMCGAVVIDRTAVTGWPVALGSLSDFLFKSCIHSAVHTIRVPRQTNRTFFQPSAQDCRLFLEESHTRMQVLAEHLT